MMGLKALHLAPGLLGLALLAFAPSCAGPKAATLQVHATAPSQTNDGTCTLPVFGSITPGTAVTVHLQWTGPGSGQDSILTVAGAPVAFTKTVPAGTYSVRMWATDAGGVGCDTTVTVTILAPPAKVAIGP